MGSAKTKSTDGVWITVKSKSEARRSRDYAEKTRVAASDELSTRTKTETDASSRAETSTASRSVSPKAAENGVDARPKRKQKRQKTSPKDVIQNHFQAQDFTTAVSDAQDRYSNIADQLGAVTDFLIAQYRGCEFSFNRSVLEQPLEKVRSPLLGFAPLTQSTWESHTVLDVNANLSQKIWCPLQQATEVPLAHVPPDVVQHALSYYRQQDLYLLADAALRLIQAVFADLPLSARAPTPKAKVLVAPSGPCPTVNTCTPNACCKGLPVWEQHPFRRYSMLPSM